MKYWNTVGTKVVRTHLLEKIESVSYTHLTLPTNSLV